MIIVEVGTVSVWTGKDLPNPPVMNVPFGASLSDWCDIDLEEEMMATDVDVKMPAKC